MKDDAAGSIGALDKNPGIKFRLKKCLCEAPHVCR
jgi:hypothetical protein